MTMQYQGKEYEPRDGDIVRMTFTEHAYDQPVIHEVIRGAPRAPLKQVTMGGTRYFVQPSPTTQASEDEAASIARRLADAVKRSEKSVVRSAPATFFDIPVTEQAVTKGHFFNIPITTEDQS